jgi:hypothetical protein
MTATRIDPERRKCAPNSKALKKVGIKRTIVIGLPLSFGITVSGQERSSEVRKPKSYTNEDIGISKFMGQ